MSNLEYEHTSLSTSVNKIMCKTNVELPRTLKYTYLGGDT